MDKNISRKLKLRLNTTIIDKCKGKISLLTGFDPRTSLTYASETWILTKRDRERINIFERKVHRRILGPIYYKETE